METNSEIKKIKAHNATYIRPCEELDNTNSIYYVTRSWHDIARLVFKNAKLFPTVHAAEPPTPQKPKPVGPKDLPVYNTPHCDYNEYTRTAKYMCAKRTKPKAIQAALQPVVNSTRVNIQKNFKNTKESAKKSFDKACKDMDCRIESTVKYLRDDANMAIRQALVTLGGISGYAFAFRNGMILKIINTSIGAGAVGAVCFPTETDVAVRKLAVWTLFTVNNLCRWMYGFPLISNKKCLNDDDQK